MKRLCTLCLALVMAVTCLGAVPAQGADLAGAVVKAYEAKGDFEAGLRFGREAAGQGLHPEWEMMYLCLKAERWQEAADWAARYDARKGGDEARRRLAQTAGADYSKGYELWQKEQYAEALPWLRKAAALGSTDAMFYLGVACDKGRGTPLDKAAAFGWYKKAAERGDAAAQFNCGNMCRVGEGTAQDKAAAFGWYQKAAERGDADAQYHLGSCFLLGRGTPADTNRALHWLRAAADQEFGPALSALGRLYDTGALPSPQPNAALEYYRRAAEAREPEAMLWMATHYAMEEDGLAKAADLCHQALELLPPDSPLAETANQLLERLEGDFFV